MIGDKMKVLKLKSVKNIRELSYGNIKNNVLLRSAQIDNITDDDLQILINKYNLRTIIDLRADFERSNNLDMRQDINYYNIPLIDEKSFKKKPSEDEIILNFLKTMPNHSDNKKYERLLQSKRAWSQIFDVLLNNEGSFLICCHQGKDRTGVVCAIILSLLGIDYNTIVEDYLLSNELLKDRIDDLYSKVVDVARKRNINPIKKDALLANKEYLDYVFEYISNTYGSLNNFYKQVCNLDADKINAIKKTYIKKM